MKVCMFVVNSQNNSHSLEKHNCVGIKLNVMNNRNELETSENVAFFCDEVRKM